MNYEEENTTRPHPLMISNWKRKTQSKIWYMLMDIVYNNPKLEHIEIEWITELGKKYKLWDKTFVKYLKRSIFESQDARYNKKILVLTKTDIILIKEMIYLEQRYTWLEPAQKNIIRFLISRLWKML